MIQKILTNLKNIPGFKTKRKLLVFESDDWGSIRMPSNEIRLKAIKIEPRIEKNDFYRYDTLANKYDLNRLFDVLLSVKDVHGNSVCFTPFCNVTNPNFQNIADSNFSEYSFETFDCTLQRYFPDQNILSVWKSGMANNVWFPEYHGREHYNIPFLKKMLLDKDQKLVEFIKIGMVHFPFEKPINNYFQSLAPTYYYNSENALKDLMDSLIGGINIFEQILGCSPISFCPPNAIFSKDLEIGLKTTPIKGIVVERNRIEPGANGVKEENYLYKYGTKNEFGQVYYRRNAKFEPVQKSYSLDQTLTEIDAAFRWGKPAVISTHRINFVSSLLSDVADKSLRELKNLLDKVKSKYPDVEFISSRDLVKIIEN